MNAYKLADLIGMCGDGGYNQDAAKMLRQQAERIADLEMTSDTGKIADLLQHQADYIDFLEKALESSINLNKAQAERKT